MEAHKECWCSSGCALEVVIYFSLRCNIKLSASYSGQQGLNRKLW